MGLIECAGHIFVQNRHGVISVFSLASASSHRTYVVPAELSGSSSCLVLTQASINTVLVFCIIASKTMRLGDKWPSQCCSKVFNVC